MKKKTNKTRKTQKSPQEILRDSATKFMAEEQKLLEKHGLGRRIIVTFPNRRRAPFTGWLAVKLLKWSRAVIDVEFGLKNK